MNQIKIDETTRIIKAGRPKLYTEEEARTRRLETQRRIRAKTREKRNEWNSKVSEEQKLLVEYLSNNIYEGETLEKIKSLKQFICDFLLSKKDVSEDI